MSSSYAAFCTSRSIMYEASVTRNEHRYATPPGRLVRVVAVGARRAPPAGRSCPLTMWNSPTLNFDGCASAWNAPSSASRTGPQAQHRAVALQRELPVHVEVPREAGRDQVLGAVLDPLHRAARAAARRPSPRRTRGRPAPCCRTRRRCRGETIRMFSSGQPGDQARTRCGSRAEPATSCRSSPGRWRGRRRRRSRTSPAGRGGSAGSSVSSETTMSASANARSVASLSPDSQW